MLTLSRRELLHRTGAGFGLLGLAGLLADDGRLAAAGSTPSAANPLAARAPHYPAKVKRIIHIYLNGGPSQVDTFDPKPILAKYDGQTLPAGNLTTERHTGAALASPFKFDRYGESGLEFSEIFARTAQHADSLCVIRSMHANTPNHEQYAVFVVESRASGES